MTTYPAPRYSPDPVRRSKRWPWIAGIVAAFLVGLLIGGASGSTQNPSASSAPVPQGSSPAGSSPEAAPTGTFGDGMYEVGVEIEPGTYKTDGPAEDALMKLCTWTKYKDASGSADAISSFNSVQGRSTVTIKSGGYMQFSGGCTWTKQ